MNTDKLLSKVHGLFTETIKTIAITCLQWGDTGKGKLVDLIAQAADIIIRGQGGDNAGHTVVAKDEKLVFHLVPSGILFDKDGKINALGTGVAFYARTFCEELNVLKEKGLSYNNLMVSLNAKLILPQHIVLDRINEDTSGSLKIGSTGRGMGPVYTDHYARVGLIVNDLLNKDLFVKKLRENLRKKIRFLETYDVEVIKEIMNHEHLLNGAYFHPKKIFDVDAIVEQYMKYGNELKYFIRDTDSLIKKLVGEKRILLEGAQGNFLSIDYGGYPYVTSSDSTAKGLVKGTGLNESDVDLTIGIIKGFYETRVGNGPFPTEFGGKKSDKWCQNKTREDEVVLKDVSINDPDEFMRGIAHRNAGYEYGATTGRLRRTGRLSLPDLRRAILTNLGNDVALTKLDVLNECTNIEICTHYNYTGPGYNYGNQSLKKGDQIKTTILHNDIMKYCEPVYKTSPGWECDISGAECLEDLPSNLRDILDYVVEETNVKPRIISIGADRNETIIV